MPTDLYATRAALAAQLTGPTATKTAMPGAIPPGGVTTYRLIYRAGSMAHTVTFSDTVPAATTVLTVTGSKAPTPTVNGQQVTWTVAISAEETLTLTIQARGVLTGAVINTATFSGTQRLTATAGVLVYTDRVYLPLVMRQY